MKTRQFRLNRAYPIDCKAYLPEGPVGRVILGVHGFAGGKDSSALAALAEAETAAGGALVCFDFPAHGSSPVGEDCLTVENCRQDLLFLAQYVRDAFPGCQRCLFATSFGGYTALLCQEELADFCWVLRAPAITMPEIFLTRLLGLTEAEFRQAGAVECGFERKLRLSWGFYEDLRRHDVLSLPLLHPARVIHGDADEVVDHADIRAWCARNPNADLAVLPGADHRFKGPGELDRVVWQARDWFDMQ